MMSPSVTLPTPCQGLSFSPALDTAPQGHTCDTQLLSPEPSGTPKKEKDVDGKKRATGGEKEKEVDLASCPSEGEKHLRSPAEKHKEKHKER